MGQVTDRPIVPATYADIEALPSNVVGEILFGQLVTHPRPAPKHSLAASALGSELFGPFHKGTNGPGGWYILDEPELHLGDHVVVPDIAGWKRERMPRLPDTAAFNIAPDWVCECLSPSTQRHDKGAKRAIYATHAVEHMWYVDPPNRCLEVFRLSGVDWIASHTFFDDDPVTAPPFDAIAFSLANLWDDPAPPEAHSSPTS